MLTNLPPELLHRILLLLGVPDLIRIQAVCRSLRNAISQNELVWQKLLLSEHSIHRLASSSDKVLKRSIFSLSSATSMRNIYKLIGIVQDNFMVSSQSIVVSSSGMFTNVMEKEFKKLNEKSNTAALTNVRALAVNMWHQLYNLWHKKKYSLMSDALSPFLLASHVPRIAIVGPGMERPESSRALREIIANKHGSPFDTKGFNNNNNYSNSASSIIVHFEQRKAFELLCLFSNFHGKRQPTRRLEPEHNRLILESSSNEIQLSPNIASSLSSTQALLYMTTNLDCFESMAKELAVLRTAVSPNLPVAILVCVCSEPNIENDISVEEFIKKSFDFEDNFGIFVMDMRKGQDLSRVVMELFNWLGLMSYLYCSLSETNTL